MSSFHCGLCGVRGCAKQDAVGGPYPAGCPTLREENAEYTKAYFKDETDLLMARVSALVSPDHEECRILKTMHFAKECGFMHIGLAFCLNVKEQAKEIEMIFRENGFDVESVICKVGHMDRNDLGVCGSNRMCNPIAQAEFLNGVGTQLNVIVGLCVGHDALFIRHSNAPVTVLAAKDHVYNHAPLEYLKDRKDNR